LKTFFKIGVIKLNIIKLILTTQIKKSSPSFNGYSIKNHIFRLLALQPNRLLLFYTKFCKLLFIYPLYQTIFGLVQANVTEQFSPMKATKAQISDMKKPEPIPTIVDDYERPKLEKYERVDIEKTKPEKPTPVINSPEVPEVKLSVENPKVNLLR